MRAEEARKVTQKALHDQNGVVGEVLRQVFNVIERAAGDGLSSLGVEYYFKGLNSDQRTAFRSRLEELGYTVKMQDSQRDGLMVTVSWFQGG